MAEEGRFKGFYGQFLPDMASEYLRLEACDDWIKTRFAFRLKHILRLWKGCLCSFHDVRNAQAMFLHVGSFGWWIVADSVLQDVARVFEKFFGENFKRGLPQRFDTKRFQTMPVRPPAIENMQCLSFNAFRIHLRCAFYPQKPFHFRAK